MRYPSLADSSLMEWSKNAIEGRRSSIENEWEWVGSGPEFDISAVDALVEVFDLELEKFTNGTKAGDRDLLEGHLAAVLHPALEDVPMNVIDDPGFWRYLSARFWDFVYWRESQAFTVDNAAKYRVYIDAKNADSCVVLRMFRRATIALENGDYRLAYAIAEGTDFWRSHILRVRTSSAPVLAQAFIMEQEQNRKKTDDLRPYASRLNRMWANVVLNVYDDDDATALLVELRDVKL